MAKLTGRMTKPSTRYHSCDPYRFTLAWSQWPRVNFRRACLLCCLSKKDRFILIFCFCVCSQAAIGGTMNVIRQAQQAGVKKYSIASSMAAVAARLELERPSAPLKASGLHSEHRPQIVWWSPLMTPPFRLEHNHKRRSLGSKPRWLLRIQCVEGLGWKSSLGIGGRASRHTSHDPYVPPLPSTPFLPDNDLWRVFIS